MDTVDLDRYWMRQALEAAAEARHLGEVPVGAVVVFENQLLVRHFNRRETDKNPVAHAEILAITEASQKLQRWRLTGCTLYVTLEPCPMCAGAIVHSRLDRLVFGARDPRTGAAGSIMNIVDDSRLNHRPFVTPGVEGEPCGRMLSDFFAARRAKG